MQTTEVLNICQEAGIPIKKAWCPFASYCLWFALQVDSEKLRALQTNIADLSTRLVHVAFGAKAGWFIPQLPGWTRYRPHTSSIYHLDQSYTLPAMCEHILP